MSFQPIRPSQILSHPKRATCALKIALLSAFFVWCPLVASAQSTQSLVDAANDSNTQKELEEARAKVAASPKDVAAALRLAGTVRSCFSGGMVKRGRADGPALVREAVVALDRATSPDRAKRALLLAYKGEVFKEAGQLPGAVLTFRESLKVNATVATSLSLIEALGALHQEVVGACKQARALTHDDDTRSSVLETCLAASGSADPRVGLAWAGAKDIALYRRGLEELAARQRANDEEFRQSNDRMVEEFHRRDSCRNQCDRQAQICSRTCGGSVMPCSSCSYERAACNSQCR